MPQSFTCLHYHLIFSTKNRLPSMAPELQVRLYNYMGGILHASKSLSRCSRIIPPESKVSGTVSGTLFRAYFIGENS
jgi:hypothetical protein